MISFGYVGWILFALLHIIKNFSQLPKKNPLQSTNVTFFWNKMAIIIAIILSVFLFLKDSPVQYYAYAAFPVFFWKTIFQNSKTLFCHVQGKSFWEFSLSALAYVLGLELLVFSYFERSLLSYALIAFSFMVPLLLGSKFRSKNPLLICYWSVSCIITSVFTFLPVQQEENISLVSGGAILISLSGAIFLINLPKTKNIEGSFFERELIKLQVFFLP